MYRLRFFVRLFCCLSVSLTPVSVTALKSDVGFTYGAGFTRAITSDPMGGDMQYSIWYPTHAADETVTQGPFEFPGVRDAAPASGRFPLVVLSHGTGGSDLGHRNVAIALAKTGIIAVALLHPRDNYRDSSGVGHRVVWEGRPRQISAVVDDMLNSKPWSALVDSAKIGAFGFSLGGYTVISVLGAQPDLNELVRHCAEQAHDDPVCSFGGDVASSIRSILSNEYQQPSPNFQDDRICAALVADPLSVLFPESELATIAEVPILMYMPEHENQLAARFHGARVAEILQRQENTRFVGVITVNGAHHFSFIAPFPPVIAQSLPEIAGDYEGFDRGVFHEGFATEVSDFFASTLTNCGQ